MEESIYILSSFHFFKKEINGYKNYPIDDPDNYSFALSELENPNISEILIFKRTKFSGDKKTYKDVAEFGKWIKFYIKEETEYIKNEDRINEDKIIKEEKRKNNAENYDLIEKYQENYEYNFLDIKQGKKKNLKNLKKWKNSRKSYRKKNERKKNEKKHDRKSKKNYLNGQLYEEYDCLNYVKFREKIFAINLSYIVYQKSNVKYYINEPNNSNKNYEDLKFVKIFFSYDEGVNGYPFNKTEIKKIVSIAKFMYLVDDPNGEEGIYNDRIYYYLLSNDEIHEIVRKNKSIEKEKKREEESDRNGYYLKLWI